MHSVLGLRWQNWVLGLVSVEEATVEDLYCMAALLDGSARLHCVDAAHTEESGSDITTTV